MAALLAPLALPWTVVITRVGVELVFPWGLANPHSLHVVPVWSYLQTYSLGLPTYLLAWPWSVFFYACALASALVALAAERGWRPLAWLPAPAPRTTAGLFAVAGLVHLLVSLGILRTRTGRVAVPSGTLVLLALAWTLAATDEQREGPPE